MIDPGRTDSIHLEQAVLFADLGESTRLYERLGDERAHEVATECLGRLEEVVARYGGQIVKHIGDEVMCTFRDADAAVEAACDMQRSVTGPALEPDLTIHVGLHWGPVLADRGDVFGDAVNLAARMVSLARPGQILTTGSTVEALSAESRERTRWVDRRAVKGKRDEIDVYEVVWMQAGITTLISIPKASQSPTLRVTAPFAEIDGNDDKTTITIGRVGANDVVLAGNQVSRWHARIERRGTKWVLCDRSTNGTLIEPDDGERVLVHQEELLLPRAGRLGVGNAELAEGESLPVRFELIDGSNP